ncbi:LysR family transcriptional regulator [uncultured Pantoea sp.]|uniref:LysR family transcriptional regulator n=1 Tax=uncultured Pantoea sp. TaxID=218084 RepID=UPI00258FB99E|nr:LysR family transcriptional regulator [uncultured Pantoea sp.]
MRLKELFLTKSIFTTILHKLFDLELMKMNKIGKLHDWHVFVTIVEHGNFSAAAKHLGISVSSVSKTISRLEEGVNSVFFHRDTHSMQVTVDGRIAYEKAKAVLEMMDELITGLRNPSRDIQGSVRLTAPALVSEFLANHWLDEYMENHKNVTLFLESRESSQFSKESSSFDHLVFRSGMIDSEDLVHRQLTPLQLSLCASREYISEHGEILHPSELFSHAFLWVHDYGFFRPITFHNGDETYVLNKSPCHRYSSDNLLATFNLVAKGKGISISTPGFMAQNRKNYPQVITILNDWKIMPVPTYIIWRQRRYYSPLFRDFIDFISKKWDERERLNEIK